MTKPRNLLLLLPFAAATLMGAFLVFQVQPVISKSVLPWFGGSPAVWTTCMLFFQVLLFGGYLYAHCLTRFFTPRRQAMIHAGLLLLAMFALPINPSPEWKPLGTEQPVLHLLALLAVHVGLPYFVLSSTGPLVQAWLSYRKQDEGVYRLYALSNVGSLAALLTYPFLVEPVLAVADQSRIWSGLFCVFALTQAALIFGLLRSSAANTANAADTPVDNPTDPPPTWYRRAAWLLLPAFASLMLLAVTNHICQEVAVIPFLWVLPLSFYLISFIVSFDKPSWYQPKMYASAAIAVVAVVSLVSLRPTTGMMLVQGVGYLLLLFLVCMLCHGEVARLKPSTKYLTQYYVLLSAGGAVGGLCVGLLCPLLFSSYVEMPIGLATTTMLAFMLFMGHRSWQNSQFEFARVRGMVLAGGALSAAMLLIVEVNDASDDIDKNRNFFGVLRIIQQGDRVSMVHGQTVHGCQYQSQRAEPTTYYTRQSGIGRTLAVKGREGNLEIGALGLGCGVLAVYGRPGDTIDYIEINPAVIDLAQKHFTYLSDSAAEVNMLQGDGRLVLERRAEKKYDVLVLDAFSSDAIPAHLLTLESVEMYRQRLKPGGVMAFHVSNKYLDLAPIVHRLVGELGWHSRRVDTGDDEATHGTAAIWVVAAESDDWFDAEELAIGREPRSEELQRAPLWTDQYHDLLSALRIF
ncbi:spermidine synthase [Roseimaritima ulvae]|uniref:Spermidine synthase n=1 Tax=Roseimaritima ulvae TaxID=980254 RepID=A0A5B9QYA9_9BACT|nr:fused MFS/spermidine synthase [Roseimaritima ulvae]QEG38951.1 spermidine synthase [Roseimaritima ulvae]